MEGVFNECTLLHLFVHLHLVVLAPHFLYHEILPELDLILVLVLICSGLGNLRLPLHAVHAFLESVLLVLDARLQGLNPLLPLVLLSLDVLHQAVQTILTLQLLLLAFPLLVHLIIHDLSLRPERLDEVIAGEL